MKKMICIILSAVMVLSLGVGAFAAEDSELTAVVKIAKSRLNPPADFTEFSSSKYEAAGQNVYDLYWSNTAENASTISATVLSSGEIISYHYRDGERDYDRSGVAAYEEGKYLQIAQEWIRKINPEYTAQLDFEGTVSIGGIHSYNVSVRFDRKIDGIPVYGDNVYISLDKYNGKVISMNSQWVHPKKIVDAEEIISAEEAGKLLGELADIRVKYEKLRDENRAVLMYSPYRQGMMVNAVNGEEFTVEYVDSEESGMAGGSMSGTMNDSAANEKTESELTREELDKIEELESLLSKDELSAIIRKMTGAAVSSFTVKSVNYREVGNKDDEKSYEASVYLTNADSESANVTFDAKTGELKSLYTYLNYNPNRKQTKKREEMKNSAERFIKMWAPDIADKAALFNYGDEETLKTSEYFNFTQSENGIEYAGNRINVRIDGSSGKVLSFSRYWDKEIAFDSAEGIITLEDAMEKYIAAAGNALYYIGNKREIYASNNVEELALIYRFSDDAPQYIDAKSGECYDWNMGQQTEAPDKYELQSDLRGHWAEKAVKTLADNGIILSYEEKFKPDEAITQKEIALLVNCFDGGARPYEVTKSDFDSYIERLVRREIIKPGEKAPDKKVSREETVTYLVRLFGFEKAAEIKGIYKTGFADEAEISVDKTGYVAIAKGIGLISGTSGKFNPKNNVTRAELATMLYNALDK